MKSSSLGILAGLSTTAVVASGAFFLTSKPALTSEASPSVSQEKIEFLRAKAQKKLKRGQRYDEPAEAAAFYVEQRQVQSGSSVSTSQVLPNNRFEQAKQHMSQMGRLSIGEHTAARAGKPSGAENLGPGNIGGRSRTLLVHPYVPNIMYSAGVAGGIWKTNDGGQNWAPIDDMMANLAVVTLAMDPTWTSIMYAGTGEGYFNGDSVRGDGIFKSDNAGGTWTQLPSTANNPNFHYVNKIRVNPNRPQEIFATTRTGVWRSPDHGASWTQVYTADPNTAGCLDLALRTHHWPSKSKDAILVASCNSFTPARIIRSDDSGDTWQVVLAEPEMGRTTIAIAPSNDDIMYALSASIDQNSPYRLGMHAVFRSDDGGLTWQARARNTDANKLNRVLLSNPIFNFFTDCGFGANDFFFNQGWYDNIIAVDPVNPDVVWAGGVDMLRSDDGGSNWDLASFWWFSQGDPNYVHADQHEIVFHPNYDGVTNTTMFVANDGGIFRTDNPNAPLIGGVPGICGAPPADTVHWTDLNNSYAITQFYFGLAYPGGETYFGGTQDNGTLRGTDTDGLNGWNEIFGGDGGYVAVDPTNTDVIFAETTRLSLRRSDDGGQTWATRTAGITGGGFLFITPFTMAATDSNTLWIGGNELWRTTDQAESWTQASTALNASMSAVAVSPLRTSRVVAGDRTGFIYTNDAADTAGATTVWTNSQPAEGWVSSVAFDPQNDDVVYATYSTFGVPHVWKSTDGGQTWQAIDQQGSTDGIPDIPAHSVAVHPTNSDTIYVGTDLGLFVSTDGGQTWCIANEGFANTVTESLQIENGHLYAFTHGRGAYRIEID